MSEVKVGYIQPIQFKDVRIGKADAVAKGSALYLPNFVTPPQLIPGTEAKDDNGNPIPGTGDVVPETVECVPLTLEKAGEAARRVVAMQSKLPLNESSVDVLNLAYAILHYENKGVK